MRDYVVCTTMLGGHSFFKADNFDIDEAGRLTIYASQQPIAVFNTGTWTSVAEVPPADIEKKRAA